MTPGARRIVVFEPDSERLGPQKNVSKAGERPPKGGQTELMRGLHKTFMREAGIAEGTLIYEA
jgi:hypothetical protein